jgi:SprT protein
MTQEQVTNILHSHVPETSLEYCLQLWKQRPFELKLTKTRQTKVGDFTCKHHNGHVRITVNHDLNAYLFLVTYVHEVAHHYTHIRHGSRIDPHGEEWKAMFQQLLIPILQETVFPEEILHLLRLHMVNPKASSFADVELTKAFRKFDSGNGGLLVLSDVPEGCLFEFQGRFFRRGKLRRTRVLCKEQNSRRSYLIPAECLVGNVQLSMFS